MYWLNVEYSWTIETPKLVQLFSNGDQTLIPYDDIIQPTIEFECSLNPFTRFNYNLESSTLYILSPGVYLTSIFYM